MDLGMNEEDMEELVEDHGKELSFEELVELHNEAPKQRIAFGDEDDKNKEKVPAFQLRTLKRCSIAGINCPNLWKFITPILPLWKRALIVLLTPQWPTFGGLKNPG
jgi:hypothetical protein